MFAYRAKGKSNQDLIRQLKGYGIVQSQRVEKAMLQTDRALYSYNKEVAYEDFPQPIGKGQTISAPHMHAHCLELLAECLKPGSKALDVGSGSGYMSACMAKMVGTEGKVIGIEIHQELVKWSIANMNADDSTLLSSGRVVLKVGDGWKGEESDGPFDCIHVGAAAEKVPEALISQLKLGGRMIIPVGTSEQYLMQVDKLQNGKIVQQVVTGVRYVPLVKSN